MRKGCLYYPLLLTATACASPAQRPLINSSPNHDNHHISADLFMELEESARIVDISYCVDLSGWGLYKPFQCASHCSEFPDFQLQKAWNTGPLLSDSSGYIALSHPPSEPRIILAFRGTYSLANTIADLSTIPQEYIPYPGNNETSLRGDHGEDATLDDALSVKMGACNNCSVHMGFYRSWINTRSEILPMVDKLVQAWPGYQLTLVGHSLGGAVAVLGALDFKARGWDPLVTTFGEPRVGNKELVRYIDAAFDVPSANETGTPKAAKLRRVTHARDPVPLLPLEEWGYKMHGEEIYISNPDLPPEIADISYCRGDEDHECIAGSDDATPTNAAPIVLNQQGIGTSTWPIPSRYKLWELFFAHRDYFWRLGLCVPGGDPKDWYRKYPHYNDTDGQQ